MITEAIGYLKESDDVWKTSIIGGVLLLFSFLLIPLFVVWGYIVRVLDRTAHGDDEAPVFEDWGEMTVDGAKVFVIGLVYALVPLVVGSVLIGGVWIGSGGTLGSAGAAAMILASLLTVAAFVAAAYAFPAAMMNFAERRHVGAGFDVETLRPVLSSGTYATRWLLSVGIILVGAVISGLFSVVPLIGLVLGSIVSFYALVTAYYVIGQTWEELHPIPVEERGSDLPSERTAI